MAGRRTIARLIGAVLCAYLVVLQAAFGGFASAGSHGAGDGAAAFALGVICHNAGADSADPDERQTDRGCCTMGCVAQVAAAVDEPTLSPFVYEARATPRRTSLERDPRIPDELARKLKRPRGPPAIG